MYFWGKKIQTIFPPSKAARETKIKSMAFVGGEVIGLYEKSVVKHLLLWCLLITIDTQWEKPSNVKDFQTA